MKKIIALTCALFLAACSGGSTSSGSGSSSGGSSSGGSSGGITGSGTIQAGYYIGTITYPNNSIHNVFGAFDGSNIFLLKDNGIQAGYRLFVGDDGSLGGFAILPTISSLYMKQALNSNFNSTQTQQPIYTSNTTGTNVVNISNISQDLNGTTAQYTFTISGSTQSQLNGVYNISLTLNNQDILSTTTTTPFIQTAWQTTDPSSSLTVTLNSYSQCSNSSDPSTCEQIFGLESGGNGNSDELCDNGTDYCYLSFGVIEKSTGTPNLINYYIEEAGQSESYTFGQADEPSIAWINTSNGFQQLVTLSFLSYKAIAYDTWVSDGTSGYVAP